MKAFSVNIISLPLKDHHFDFELGDAFFEEYGAETVSKGDFTVEVILTKKETFIEARFKIRGHARLVCDRSLESFDYPLNLDKKIVFKYGEEEVELSDEIVVIHRDRTTLDLGQYLYEFIVLEIPMKKLHPRYDDNEEEAGEGKIIYSSAPDDDSGDDEEIDPMWEQLKKLK